MVRQVRFAQQLHSLNSKYRIALRHSLQINVSGPTLMILVAVVMITSCVRNTMRPDDPADELRCREIVQSWRNKINRFTFFIIR